MRYETLPAEVYPRTEVDKYARTKADEYAEFNAEAAKAHERVIDLVNLAGIDVNVICEEEAETESQPTPIEESSLETSTS